MSASLPRDDFSRMSRLTVPVVVTCALALGAWCLLAWGPTGGDACRRPAERTTPPVEPTKAGPTCRVVRSAANEPLPPYQWLEKHDAATLEDLERGLRGERAQRPDRTPSWEAFAAGQALVRPDDLERVLARVAEDADLERRHRARALRILCRVADLPLLLAASSGPRGVDDEEIQRTLALWGEVKDLSRADRLLRSVAYASEVSDVLRRSVEMRTWLAEHTGFGLDPSGRQVDLEDWDAAWNALQAEDPRTWFVQALGLEDSPESLAPERLLGGMLSAERIRKVWFHHLLRLAVDGEEAAPAWTRPGVRAGPRADDVWLAWQRRLTGDRPPALHRIRVAALTWTEMGDPAEVAWEEVHPIALDERLMLDSHTELAPIAAPARERRYAVALRLPGEETKPPPRTRPEADSQPRRLRHRLTTWVRFQRRYGHLVLQDQPASDPVPRHHTVLRRRSPLRRGTVTLLGGMVGARSCLVVGRLEPMAGPEGPLSIADWRRALVRDLDRRADEFEALFDETDRVATFNERRWVAEDPNPVTLAHWLSVPEAVPALIRIGERTVAGRPGYVDGGTWSAETTARLRPARLMAGDLTPLVSQGALPLPRDPALLLRLALTTGEPRFRDPCLRKLSSGIQYDTSPVFDAEVRRQVRTRLEAEGVRPPPWVIETESDGTRRLPWIVLAGLGLALTTLGGLLRARSRPWTISPAAAWTLVVGVGLASLSVFRESQDLHLQGLGLLWATVGALFLALTARGVLAGLSGLGFALALAVLAVTLLLGADGATGARDVVALGLRIGVGAIPLLALALARSTNVGWTLLAIGYGVGYVFAAEDGGGVLVALVGASLVCLLATAYHRGAALRRERGQAPSRVHAFLRRHAVPLGVAGGALAIGVTLFAARTPDLPGVDVRSAAWHESRGPALESEDEHAEAADAYVQSLRSLGWWDRERASRPLETRYPLSRVRRASIGLMRARSRAAKARHAAGEMEAASRLALRGLLEMPAAGAERAFGTTAPSELALARRELLRLVALHGVRQSDGRTTRRALLALGSGMRDSFSVAPDTLQRIAGLLRSPAPAHRRDGLFLARAVLTPPHLPDRERRASWIWLGEDPALATSLIVDLIRWLPSEGERSFLGSPATHYAFLERFTHELAPFTSRQLEAALVMLAKEAGLSPFARAGAVEILCRVADLPLTLAPGSNRWGYSGRDPRLPRPDSEGETTALALWREVRGLASDERLRVLVAFAVGQLPAEGKQGDSWLWRHTHQWDLDRVAWEKWLEERRETSPRDWVLFASGLGDDARAAAGDIEYLLDMLFPPLGAVQVPWGLVEHRDQRSRIHHLLALDAPRDAAAPVWCGGVQRREPWESEPVALSAAWTRALDGIVRPSRYRVRIAQLRLGPHDRRVEWEEILDLGLDEGRLVESELAFPSHLLAEAKAEAKAETACVRILPGLPTGEVAWDMWGSPSAGVATPPPDTFREIFQVTWGPKHGIELRPRPTYVFTSTHGTSSTRVPVGLEGVVVRHDGGWNVAPAPVLAFFERAHDEEVQLWTIAEWQARVERSFRDLLDAVRKSDAVRLPLHRRTFHALVDVASVLPVPGALEPMDRLEAALPKDMTNLAAARTRKLLPVARALARDPNSAATPGGEPEPADAIEPRPGSSGTCRATILALGALLGLALLLAVWPRTATSARRWAAAVLIVGGLALAAHRTFTDGEMWPTLAVGYACAALGGLLLARATAGFAGWLSPSLLAVATALYAAEALGSFEPVLLRHAAVWAGAGLAALPLLAGSLRHPKAGPWGWPLAYALAGILLRFGPEVPSELRLFPGAEQPAVMPFWLTLWLLGAIVLLLRGVVVWAADARR